MKIFITGATGYVGSAVASAFRRAGHDVTGLARTQEKAKLLAKHEIRPVIGTMQQIAAFNELLRESEVLVHCAAEMSKEHATLDRSVIDAFLSAGKQAKTGKTIIYTSGVWVYGNTYDKLVDESTPVTPIKLVAWRPAHEELILNAATKTVHTIVIRPGCVYGGTSGLTGMWFESATKEGFVKIIGDGSNRWAMVHREDLADAYVRAAESGLSGETFNIVDRSRFTLMENAIAASTAAGVKNSGQTIPLVEAQKIMGDFAECLALDQHIDGRKAVRLLGWTPKFGGFRDSADIFFLSWQAGR